ncbi:type VI secretion protein, partial [Streptomyces sp. NPDC002812]
MPQRTDHPDPRPQGGIPDGLLVGLLAFLLGLAVLTWTATGLAALFTKGAWPSKVTFTRTPTAVRSLIAQPHDIPAAWPDTPPEALSNWGLFWGLFISQLLVLLVLTIFTLGVVARTKSRHRLKTEQDRQAPPPTSQPYAASPTSQPYAAPSTSQPPSSPPASQRYAVPPASQPYTAPPAFEERGSGELSPAGAAVLLGLAAVAASLVISVRIGRALVV